MVAIALSSISSSVALILVIEVSSLLPFSRRPDNKLTGQSTQVAFEVEHLDGNDMGLLLVDGVMLAIMIATGFAVIVRALSLPLFAKG